MRKSFRIPQSQTFSYSHQSESASLELDADAFNKVTIVSNLPRKEIRNKGIDSTEVITRDVGTSSNTATSDKSTNSNDTKVSPSQERRTQLVNCRGHDEILLDSDNLINGHKFRSCTRRRDESFV